MKTELLLDNDKDIKKAAEYLRNGELVGIPTETVYGLAANAFDGKAVAAIFTAKGRPMDNPLIVHISDFSQLSPLVSEIPPKAKILADKFWPGPLTIIMKKSALIPDEVSAGLETVAIRFPVHKVAQKIISTAGVPLAAPSANISGRPSPTTAAHVMHDMDGKISAVVDGGKCSVGVESTVISLAQEPPRLLRPGGITLEQLKSVLGEVVMDDAVLHPLKDGVKVSSPGMKYKHYSPNANVIIIEGTKSQFDNYVNNHAQNGVMALCYNEDVKNIKVPVLCYGSENDDSSLARELFDCLRKADEKNAVTVYARCPEPVGVGLAVCNRLMRAAGFEVIKIE